MARPLSTPDPLRSGASFTGRASASRLQVAVPDAAQIARQGHDLFLEDMSGGEDGGHGRNGTLLDLQQLRSENEQLRGLCAELEQALHEATQHAPPEGWENQVREYEALLEEKSEMIRSLHEQVQELQAAQAEMEAAAEAAPEVQKPVPREAELLALSEELERERRQLQEDEQTLMEQMREMEIGMARERAEMARQRNDLQRLQSEIRHELERLERSGALQSKMENLKSKLQDATTRRGAAPGSLGTSGILGRMFGQTGER